VIAYVYPADVFGCGYYRLIWVAKALRAAGHDVRLRMPSDREGIGASIDMASGRLVNVIVPDDADVIVMQRVSLSHLVEAIPMIRAKGVAVVVDMDDDLTKIDPSNPAFVALRADAGDRRHTVRNASNACLAATLVTVSTPQLLKVYAPHGRGVVLENRIPARYLDIPHDPDLNSVGWAGSVHSHPLDLQEVGPAVARLVHERVTTYRGVGPGQRLRAALGLPDEPAVTGSVELQDWPDAIATHIGVGIAPLADTLFNWSKSWLKPLEMAALGVPWVASPRPEYQRLSRTLGVGLLAERPKDWYRQLKKLVTDPVLRKEQSTAGREAAADWTIEGNAWRWLDVWQSAVDMQRHGKPAPACV
jgi:hypothetical protein